MSKELQPTLPNYDGGCNANVVPEVIKALVGQPTADWVPAPVKKAKQIVLLVLDGLGWEQLQARKQVLPTLAAFEGGAITTVAPSTTATVLTSIVTGRRPNATGMLGYRMLEQNRILNTLKWATEDGDATESIPPETYQTQPAFAANEIPAVIRRQFIGHGFSSAHMQGAKMVGYSAMSSIPVEVWRLMNEGESFVYAYYDGIDTVAHAHGLGEHYEAELYTVDRLIRDLLAGMPKDSALVVTSDHGQVEVGNRVLKLEDDIAAKCYRYSGEGRFLWLHAKGGMSVDGLADLCREHYGDLAWVKTREEVINEGIFGGPLEPKFADRLGDVAIIASSDVAFAGPDEDITKHTLVCRHGSLTNAEMLVPLLAQMA